MQNDKKKERIKKLRDEGFTYSEISEFTGVPKTTVRQTIKPRLRKEPQQLKHLSTFFNFDQVVELLKQKKENTEIVRILNPEVDVKYFYEWRTTLSEQQQKIIKGFSTFSRSHKLKEIKVDRKFKYIETPDNISLPRGA